MMVVKHALVRNCCYIGKCISIKLLYNNAELVKNHGLNRETNRRFATFCFIYLESLMYNDEVYKVIKIHVDLQP